MGSVEASIADMNCRTQESGRRVRYALNPFVAVAASEQAALDETVSEIFKHDPDPDVRKIKQRMLPTLKAGCVGKPEDVRRQLRRFGDIGIDLILCKMLSNAENIERVWGEALAPMHTSPR